MLSKLSKLVMGLLWARPMNPYEITKLVDMRVVQDWFPLTAPSVYTTIKNLEHDGYITGITVQDTKLPPKTFYSLTEAGEQALTADLSAGLCSYEALPSDFGIAMFHISALSKEEALTAAQQRADLLSALLEKAKERLEFCKDKVPFNLRMMLTCNVYRLETELRVTQDLVSEIQKTSDWNTSFTRYLD